MTRKPGHTSLHRLLAFKAYEIEELADVYFFRPAGAVIAHASRPVGISPTMLTVFGGIVGVSAGVALYHPSLGLVGFVLLVLHSVFDSADGQLARLTNRSSDLGRILDGVGGYATFGAVYLALALGIIARGGSDWIIAWAVAAGISNALQAQFYDYHRTVYANIVLHARPPSFWGGGLTGVSGSIARGYLRIQRLLTGSHADVEEAMRRRAVAGRMPDEDRERYRQFFYWSVRRWNVLGDNTRIYAVGLLALVGHLDWFFAFVVVLMNSVVVLLWAWQEILDRRFLAFYRVPTASF